MCLKEMGVGGEQREENWDGGGWLFVGLSGKSSESRTFEQKRLERDFKKNGRFNLGLYYRQAWRKEGDSSQEGNGKIK